MEVKSPCCKPVQGAIVFCKRFIQGFIRVAYRGLENYHCKVVGSINTYSLHCSSFLGLPYRILVIYLVKPKKGTRMETIGINIPVTRITRIEPKP